MHSKLTLQPWPQLALLPTWRCASESPAWLRASGGRVRYTISTWPAQQQPSSLFNKQPSNHPTTSTKHAHHFRPLFHRSRCRPGDVQLSSRDLPRVQRMPAARHRRRQRPMRIPMRGQSLHADGRLEHSRSPPSAKWGCVRPWSGVQDAAVWESCGDVPVQRCVQGSPWDFVAGARLLLSARSC